MASRQETEAVSAGSSREVLNSTDLRARLVCRLIIKLLSRAQKTGVRDQFASYLRQACLKPFLLKSFGPKAVTQRVPA
jgi:hypothetical protein